ncbi:uncharacterized protein LOC107857641 [Capsicum annuum]|uniref:uncharacterized protein LOC107857641 n=1 Tax=Capsicum annuum TaxID=4072 RepID=UPI0007BED1E9|nr:uncharacterized protein LOC107857641 [Capsicum annuum]
MFTLSKYVEEIVLSNNNGKCVTAFLMKNIFSRFGSLGAIISDGGSHFCNSLFKTFLEIYGVKQKVETPYHSYRRGQAEVSNHKIKSILAKTVNVNRMEWDKKLDDALWAYQIAFKTPIGAFLYQIVFGKICHLPIKLKHKPLWTLKRLNPEWSDVAKLRHE